MGRPEADLEAAAWQVRDVRMIRWRPDAKRDGPVADRSALVAVCAAVITTAGAPVPLDVLTRVVARRFNVDDPPLLALVDAVELTEGQPGRPCVTAEVVTEAGLPRELAGVTRVEQPGVERLIAAGIWAALAEQERLQLPLLDEAVRVQGAAGRVGWARSRPCRMPPVSQIV